MLNTILKSLILIGATGLVALLALPVLSQSSNLLEDSPYVFRVEIYDCTHEPKTRAQTGFQVIGLPGIVTALHGVADCQNFHAVSTGEKSNSYQDLILDRVNIAKDLALLVPKSGSLATNQGFPSANCTSVQADEKVYVLGHPLGIYGQLPRALAVGLQPTQTLQSLAPPGPRERLSERRSPRLDQMVLQVVGSVLPGDSGAPVLSSDDCVIGVVNGGLLSGTSGIAWAIPWLNITWSTAAGPEFERLQQQPGAGVFTFAGNKDVAVANLTLQIDEVEPISIQIPRENGHKTYDLRRFGVPPITQSSTRVTIEDADGKNVIAEGIIDASNRNLPLRDKSTYQAITVDIKRGFLLLSVTFTDDAQPTRDPTPGFTFKILVTDPCNNDAPIPNARVIGSVEVNNVEANNNDQKVIRTFDTNTGTRGEVLLDGLPGEPEKLKIIITSIRVANFSDLPSHHTIPNLGAVELSETIRLTPDNNNCKLTPEPPELPTPSPMPTFAAPKIFVVPSRISKERLAGLLKITLTDLEWVNPHLSDPVEIDTIIVVPSRKQ